MPKNPHANPASHGPRGLSAPRLLATPLGTLLPGLEVGGDIYARNGFRLLGVSALTDRHTIAREAGRLRTRIQLSPAALDRFCIHTGYDEHCRVEDVERCVSRLQDPRFRLLSEVFWPHLADGNFDTIRSNRCIGTPEVASCLERAAAAESGCQAMLLSHAAAIAYHNTALAGEVAFLVGGAPPDEQYWRRALQLWRSIIEDKNFWSYLQERVKGCDDPRLQPSDVDILRAALPPLLLTFHTRLAQSYAEAGELDACKRHLRLIQSSAFAYDDLCKALIVTVQKLTANWLEPLVKSAKQQLLESAERLSRKQFVQLCAPILVQMHWAADKIKNDFSLDDDLFQLTDFDPICALVLDALNRRIEYGTDDRERSLIYFLVTAKQLVNFPISTILRRRVEGEIRETTRLLYPDGNLPANWDATRCHFSALDVADPDASLLLPVYKVTERTVQVDHFRNTAGIRVSYRHRRVLVPRSAAAKSRHEGKDPRAAANLHGSREAEILWYRDLHYRAVREVRRLTQERQTWGGVWKREVPVTLALMLVGGFAGASFSSNWLTAVTAMCSGVLALVICRLDRRARLRWAERILADLGAMSDQDCKSPPTMRVRGEFTKTGCPGYSSTIAKGFKSGTEPSSGEMQMTETEKQQARAQLR